MRRGTLRLLMTVSLKNHTLDEAWNFALTDGSEFEELGFDSDYEDDILKKNKNKNHRNQSILDEEDDIPLNTLMQEPINQSDVITEISQDPRANNEQEIVPI